MLKNKNRIIVLAPLNGHLTSKFYFVFTITSLFHLVIEQMRLMSQLEKFVNFEKCLVSGKNVSCSLNIWNKHSYLGALTDVETIYSKLLGNADMKIFWSKH